MTEGLSDEIVGTLQYLPGIMETWYKSLEFHTSSRAYGIAA